MRRLAIGLLLASCSFVRVDTGEKAPEPCVKYAVVFSKVYCQDEEDEKEREPAKAEKKDGKKPDPGRGAKVQQARAWGHLTGDPPPD